MANPETATSAVLRSNRSQSLGEFVGRTREIGLLQAGLEQTLAGSGKLFLVSGEPGIGKTRLADEFGASALDREAEVLWGRCWEGGGAPAYWPWVQILRSLAVNPRFGSLADKAREHISSLTARVAEAADASSGSGDLPSITGRQPEQERFRLFDSLQELLREAASIAPLIIILDDCHAADHASLSLLAFVARELRQSRIAILVTYRELEVQNQPALSERFTDLARDGESIVLRGISQQEVSRFLESAAGGPQQSGVASSLHQATEGNPFFLSEIVHLLLAEGRLAMAMEGLGGFTLPESVRVVIRRRIGLAAPATRKILSTASVIGREFDLTVLSRLGDWTGEHVRTAIDDATRHAVIAEVAGARDRYRFSHALFPETLSDDLPRLERHELHRKIGDALEELYSGDLENHLPGLAYHLVEALPSGSAEKAVAYATRAASRADSILAYEEAARLYALALKATEGPHSDNKTNCDLLLKLGAALNACGRFVESRKSFSEAAAVAIRLGDPLKQASAALGCAIIPSTPGVPDPELVRTLEQSLNALGNQDSAARAMVMARLAEELLWSDQSARREALSRDAVTSARRIGDDKTLVEVLYRRHITLTGPDTIDDRLALSAEIAKLIHKVGGGDVALRARYLRIWDLLEAGEISAVDREIANYIQVARELRQTHSAVSDLMLAMRALMNARLEDAEKLALSGFTAAQARRESFAAQILALQLSLIRREQGRLGELEPIIRGISEQYPAIVFARCGLAWCYGETGRRAEAAAEFERLAAPGLGTIKRDATWLPSMIFLSEVCAALEDRERAEELYDLLTPYAPLNATLDVYVCYGSVALYLARLAQTAGQIARAEEHYQSAILFNLRMGSHLWLAHSRHRYAALLLARNHGDDAMRAFEMIGLALETANSFGLKALTERLEVLRGPDLAAEAGPDGTVSLLFSDIEASTPMHEQLGDIRAHEMVRTHDAIVREKIAAFDGFEVKTIGDAFMVAFASARRALLCAVAIERAFEKYNTENPEAPMRVSVGLHTGEAIKERNDYYGKAVILASRLGGYARGGEILVSSTFHDLTAAAGDIRFDTGREIELKGLEGTHRVYSVLWRDAPAGI